MTNRTEELQTLKSEAEELRDKRNRTEVELENAQKLYAEKTEELEEEFGIKPEALEEEIKRLETKIEEDVKRIRKRIQNMKEKLQDIEE